ncbi:MAG: WecB/TagA/CpsF family glycosyltransferase [Ilumatobacteraceae bacterium]
MTASLDRTCVLLGVPVDDVTLDEAVGAVAAMVEHGRATGRVHQVATVNVDFLVNATEHGDLLEILQRSDLSIPDGMPVVWASRVLGSPLRERTTGIDLLPAIAGRAARDGHRVVLFGGAPGVAAQAADLLRDRYPGLDVTPIEAPVIGPDGVVAAGAVDPLPAIRDCRPDIVCVALGNPKQEHWIARHGEAVGAPVAIGIGGSLDFLTGVTRRAPAWMQRSGLEWLHRAVSEPRRLIRRYARDFRVFLPGVARQAWQGRRRAEAIAPTLDVLDGPDGEVPVVRLTGPLPAASPETFVASRLRGGLPVTIDLARAGRLDNVTVSTLVGLVRRGRRTGAPVDVVHVPRDVRAGGTRGLGALLAGANRRPLATGPGRLRPRGGESRS